MSTSSTIYTCKSRYYMSSSYCRVIARISRFPSRWIRRWLSRAIRTKYQKNTLCPIPSRNPWRKISCIIIYSVPLMTVFIICTRLVVFIELKMTTWYSALQMSRSLAMSKKKKNAIRVTVFSSIRYTTIGVCVIHTLYNYFFIVASFF